MPDEGVSAIVLAGGRSTRFGSDKLAASVGGRPLLHHAILGVSEVADEVVVVTAFGRPGPDLPDVGRPLRTVTDSVPYPGPLAALRQGAATARHRALLVVGGDMPTLVASVLRLLTATVIAGREAAMLGDDSPRPGQTLPLALDRQCALDRAAALLEAGDRSLRGLVNALDTAVIHVAAWRALDPTGVSLRDVDRREDLPPAFEET